MVVSMISTCGSSMCSVTLLSTKPSAMPTAAPPPHLDHELAEAYGDAQVSCHGTHGHDAEQDRRRAVVEEALALDDDGQPLAHRQVLEDGEDRDRIRSRHQGSEGEG